MTTALLLGAAVGLILALTGAGGGILAVPALVFGAGLGVAQAGPIGLLSVGLAAMLGAGLGLREGVVRYRAAGLMAATGVLVAPLGLWLAQHMGNRWLSMLFGLVLFYVALRSARQARGHGAPTTHAARPCVRDARSGRFIWTAPCARVLTLAGSAAGLLSGLLGVGGGFVMVPALRRYTDLDMQSTVATSLAVIGLVSAAGVAGSAMAGTLNWQVGLPFAAGALAGMLGGRPLARRLSGPSLQLGFAALAAAVAASMVVKALA